MDEPWKHYAKWKMLNTKGHVLFDFISPGKPFLYEMPRLGKSMEMKSRLLEWLPGTWGKGKWRMIVIGYGIVWGDDANVLKSDYGGGCPTLNILVTTECVLSLSGMSDSLWPHGLQPARLLCPRDSPGKNTGVGCHALLQGIFPIQGLDPGRFFTVWATREATE